MNQKIVKLLYRSFDEKLAPGQQQRLDEALATSKELRAEKARITAMRAMISDNREQAFQPFFAEKVMRRIRENERVRDSFFDSLVVVFRPVAIAATTLLIILMSYNVFNSDTKSLASALAEPEITLEHALDPALPLAME